MRFTLIKGSDSASRIRSSISKFSSAVKETKLKELCAALGTDSL